MIYDTVFLKTTLLVTKQGNTKNTTNSRINIPFLLQIASKVFNNILKIFTYRLIYSLFFFYERNVRTVPLIIPLQIGHFLREGAHSWHTTRWPQGMNTIETSLSIHTLQVRSSCNLLNCSSSDRPSNNKKSL